MSKRLMDDKNEIIIGGKFKTIQQLDTVNKVGVAVSAHQQY